VKYALLVVAGGILFGTTGTARALAPDSAGSTSVGLVRLTFGGLLFGLLGLVMYLKRRRSAPEGPTPPHPRPWLKRAPACLAVVICAASILVYQDTFFVGTMANGVMVGTVVALGSSPLFAGVFEWIVLRRRPGLIWLAATVICVAGMVALSGVLSSAHSTVSVSGLAHSLIAGACYAVLAVGSKWLLQRGWTALDTAVATMATGAVMAVVPMLRTDLSWLREPRGVAVAAWLAVATIVIAFLLNVTGLTHTPASTVTTLNLSEPATASVLGVVVLGEAMTLLRALGIAAVAAGVLLLGLTTRDASGGVITPRAEAAPSEQG